MAIAALLFIQLALWSLYSLVVALSKHDRFLFEALLLVMFAYFGYLLSFALTGNRQAALVMSAAGSVVYIAAKLIVL